MKTANLEQAKKFVSDYLKGQNYDIAVNGEGWYGDFDSYIITESRTGTVFFTKRIFLGNNGLPWFIIPIPKNEQEFLEILKLIDK